MVEPQDKLCVNLVWLRTTAVCTFIYAPIKQQNSINSIHFESLQLLLFTCWLCDKGIISQARSKPWRVDRDWTKRGQTCVCQCVCEHKWSRIVYIFKRAPLSGTQHSRTEGKQQAARLRADNTVALRWLGRGGMGGDWEQSIPESQPSSRPLAPSSSLSWKQKTTQLELEICVSLWEGPPKTTYPQPQHPLNQGNIDANIHNNKHICIHSQ